MPEWVSSTGLVPKPSSKMEEKRTTKKDWTILRTRYNKWYFMNLVWSKCYQSFMNMASLYWFCKTDLYHLSKYISVQCLHQALLLQGRFGIQSLVFSTIFLLSLAPANTLFCQFFNCDTYTHTCTVMQMNIK